MKTFGCIWKSHKENLTSLGEMVTFQTYEEGHCFSMCLMLYAICASTTMKPHNLKPKLHSKEKYLTETGK